jgi:uncharacterized protein YbjT (DUF2867 family)
MPVLVTGPETTVGRAAVDALLRTGGQVRTYVDPDVAGADVVEDLRRAGCHVARGDLADESRLELALEQVHTVVHLAGGPMADSGDEVDEVASTLSAAIGARCKRFVWLSHLGADRPAGNPYLEACAEVESLLADGPLESIVLRRALTYGPADPLTAVIAAGEVPAAVAQARHSPVFAEDLAAAIVQADRPRGSTEALHLVVAVAGPRDMTVADLVEQLAPAADAAARGLTVPPRATVLPAHVLDLLSRDLVREQGVLGAEGTTVEAAVARMAGR